MKDFFAEEVGEKTATLTLPEKLPKKDFYSEEIENDFFSKEVQPFISVRPERETPTTTGIARAKNILSEYGKQFFDLLKVPSAITGLPHLPMESQLATKTMPRIVKGIAEKATTPIGIFTVPQLGTKYTKAGIPLPKITLGEVSPTPLDIALLGLISISGIQDVAGKLPLK